VRALLRRLECASAPALVVLDNAWLARAQRWEAGLGKPAPLPEGPAVHLLVTTRNEYFAGSAFAHLCLGPLAREDARELLLATSGRTGAASPAQDGLDALLERSAGHALALELCGVQLRRAGPTLPHASLDALRPGGAEFDHARHTGYAVGKASEAATLHGAFAQLWYALDGELRRWWSLAAQCDPAAAASALPARALEALGEFHLVRWDASGGRWAMHPLVREFGAAQAAAAAVDGDV
jgi:hypothetical protein